LQLSSKNLNHQEKVFTSVNSKVVIKFPIYDEDATAVNNCHYEITENDDKVNHAENLAEKNKRKSINLTEVLSTEKEHQ